MEDKHFPNDHQLIIPKDEATNGSPFRERAKFYEARKTNDETVFEYYTKLTSLSINCQFDDHFDRILCDKFITGFRLGEIFDRMCNQNKDISLNDALDLALKFERDLTNAEGNTTSAEIRTLNDFEMEVIVCFQKRSSDQFFPIFNRLWT